MQTPTQIVDQPRTLPDKALTVIDEQPNIELRARQLRDRQRVQALAQRGSGDLNGIDDIGLAALPSGARQPSASGHVHAHDTLAAGQQEALKRARDMAAVLDRPHACCVQPPRPQQQIIE